MKPDDPLLAAKIEVKMTPDMFERLNACVAKLHQNRAAMMRALIGAYCDAVESGDALAGAIEVRTRPAKK